MALVHRGIGAEAIEVARALDVPDVGALAAGEHHVERLVIVRAVLTLQRDVVRRRARGDGMREAVAHAAASARAGRAPAVAPALARSSRSVMQ